MAWIPARLRAFICHALQPARPGGRRLRDTAWWYNPDAGRPRRDRLGGLRSTDAVIDKRQARSGSFDLTVKSLRPRSVSSYLDALGGNNCWSPNASWPSLEVAEIVSSQLVQAAGGFSPIPAPLKTNYRRKRRRIIEAPTAVTMAGRRQPGEAQRWLLIYMVIILATKPAWPGSSSRPGTGTQTTFNQQRYRSPADRSRHHRQHPRRQTTTVPLRTELDFRSP